MSPIFTQRLTKSTHRITPGPPFYQHHRRVLSAVQCLLGNFFEHAYQLMHENNNGDNNGNGIINKDDGFSNNSSRFVNIAYGF